MLIVFIIAACIAVAGFLMVVVQERNRVSLTAEYQAYQFATSLLQEFQTNAAFDFAKVEGLEGFGVYASSGKAVIRTASAPETVTNPDVGERISDGRIMLLLRQGGPMRMREGRMWQPDASGRSMTGNPFAGGFVYIDYDAPALSKGPSVVSIVGVLTAFALALAFALIYSMFRRLEKYRSEETKNKELIALGEASSTLADEIKNPLAVIVARCSIMKKKNPGNPALDDVDVIEGETYRIVALVERIREILVRRHGEGR